MGDSACLRRSFSHPPSDSSREAKESDPNRCLGESISFGRYMSESLAWEKWSTFSHNRYLEEAEKFSKPGSVAQKRAYFEAHYKKKAAERAAALVEEANAAAHNVSESETNDKHHNESFMDSELVEADSHKAIDGPHVEDAPSTAICYSAEMNVCNPNVEELETTKVESAEAVMVEGVEVEDSALVENIDQIEKVEDHHKIVTTQEEKKLNKVAPSKDIPASPSKKRQANCSSKLLTRASKLPVSPSKRMISVPLRNGINSVAECERTAGDLVEKKRLTVKSLHMSVNFASGTGKTSKTNSVFQEVGSARSDENLFDTSQDSSTPLRTSTRASVNKLIKQPSVKLQPEDRRTRTLLSKSISGGIAGDGKAHSLSMDCSKPSYASGFKARTPTISSPFTFKSEERAAKRKEFFQKLEDKIYAKEAEKVQPQTRPKISLTQPRSPNFRRKPIPSPVQDSSSRPPRIPLVRNGNSKRVTEKFDRTTTCSVTSLPKKNAYENASPNIQH
ncbi:hypothetical protein CMV_003384 [Castanea mollissima]|uniref:TPX2 C-terminal domain-containing protein n=1 Tax=Castanea mollissima TaxID=60419 RepID=A0A8J4VWM6_9ROSI|nr:hypothetical protein CMV_003384 [Castanea mollissima]